MKQTLSEKTLLQLSEFISTNLALYFPKERWENLERNVIIACKEFGYNDVEKFIQHIISSPLTREHVEILAANLTINESYFWREPQTFEALEQKIIPELMRNRQNGEKRLRIWSAGCSTGEEPYSIAIALERTIPNIKDWNISILATDISPWILHKATSGEYGRWSFRGTPQWLKNNYFIQKENKKFEIIPKIKEMVRFEYLNLAEDIYPSSINDTNAMDIIYCRNVLMYFTQARFRQVARGLYNSLIQGGYLVVSASELSVQNFPDFKPVNFPGMVLYQKTSKKNKNMNKPTFTDVLAEQVVFTTPLKPDHIIDPKKSRTAETQKVIIENNAIPERPGPIQDENLKLFSLGNYQDVIDELQRKDQALEERILLIQAFANQGKFIEAIDACKKAIALYKIDPRIHYLYATILQENNQPDEAIESLKHAIYLDSNFVLAYYSLGRIYERLGNFKSANKCNKNILTILSKCRQDEILFESDGLTAGRFKEIINATNQTRAI